MKTTFAILLISLTAALLSAREAEPPAREISLIPDEKTGFVILDPATGTRFKPEVFSAMLAGADVVYVGESHDQRFTHLAQLEALKILASAKKNKVIVGFEMLNSGLQPVLDRYASGQISEQEFISQSDWKKEWGFDFGLYKPLFDYIRKNKLQAAALNVPRAAIKKIARGGMGALSPEEKKALPEEVSINHDPLYISYLRSAYSGHGDTPIMKTITWDNYLLSMAAWNEGMGHSAVKAIRKHKGHAMLVIAGNGHVIYNAGIPFSIRTRLPGLEHLSVYTEDIEKAEDFRENPSPLADLIWFVRHERKTVPPAPPRRRGQDPVARGP